MKAKKQYGQNFLIDDTIIKKIVSLFGGTNEDLILEIGPGRGALTQELIKTECPVLAIEIDTDMQNHLNKINSKNFDVLFSDILSIDLESIYISKKFNSLYIFGNLPYYITSPIMEKLIKEKTKAKKMYFMVQKEVAERIIAKCGSKQYGLLTLMISFYYNSKICFNVPKSSFYPVPNVESAFIELTLRDNPLNIDYDKYISFLKTAFSHKRKQLKNNLNKYDWNKIITILKKYNLPETVRAEQIPESIFVEIRNNI